MSSITIPAENRRITDVASMSAYLKPLGITYERWPLEDRCDPNAPDAEILRAYDPEIQALCQARGYVTADVINVTPDTPNLDAMLNKFNKEHTHADDEVRFILKGRGIFHIHPPGGPVFALQVEAGDLINVPAGTRHWFDLCNERQIRAIRLFKDKSGWTPEYVDQGVHAQYQPVCWGPSYLPKSDTIASVVKP